MAFNGSLRCAVSVSWVSGELDADGGTIFKSRGVVICKSLLQKIDEGEHATLGRPR